MHCMTSQIEGRLESYISVLFMSNLSVADVPSTTIKSSDCRYLAEQLMLPQGPDKPTKWQRNFFEQGAITKLGTLFLVKKPPNDNDTAPGVL